MAEIVFEEKEIRSIILEYVSRKYPTIDATKVSIQCIKDHSLFLTDVTSLELFNFPNEMVRKSKVQFIIRVSGDEKLPR